MRTPTHTTTPARASMAGARHGLTLSVEEVTPDIAAHWLSLQGLNRKLRRAKVARYASLIKGGRWYPGVGSVVFDRDGCLIDGQHRLNGLIASGRSAVVVVVRGVDPDAKFWIDTGSTRTGRDAVLMAGIDGDDGAISSATKYLLKFRRAGHTNTMWEPELEDVRDGLLEFPDIIESVEATKAARTSTIHGPHSAFAFCHYIFSRQDAEAADAFFRGVLSGLGVESEDDARHLLGTRLRDEAASQAKIGTHYVIKLTFKAWQLWRKGEGRRLLRVRQHGPAQEGWPNIGPVPGVWIGPSGAEPEAA